jgi:hypothetical protein
MNFGIFVGLFGIPLGIILLAVFCYYVQKDLWEEKAAGSESSSVKGGVNQ